MSITHGPSFLSIIFHAKSSKEQKRLSRPQMSNHPSTIQWHVPFAVALKLLREPRGIAVPSLRNTELAQQIANSTKAVLKCAIPLCKI